MRPVASGLWVTKRCSRFLHLLYCRGKSLENQLAAGHLSVLVSLNSFDQPLRTSPLIGLAPTRVIRPMVHPAYGFLGIANAAFRPSGPAQKDMALNGGNANAADGRTSLLKQFEDFRRRITHDQVDDITAQAWGF